MHTLDEIEAAVASGGCDYLMFGTVFPSAGKPAGHPTSGLDGLARACRRSALPIVAIGGIAAEHEDAIARAGAAGVAAIGRFM